jgi:hypothetical protein
MRPALTRLPSLRIPRHIRANYGRLENRHGNCAMLLVGLPNKILTEVLGRRRQEGRFRVEIGVKGAKAFSDLQGKIGDPAACKPSRSMTRRAATFRAAAAGLWRDCAMGGWN